MSSTLSVNSLARQSSQSAAPSPGAGSASSRLLTFWVEERRDAAGHCKYVPVWPAAPGKGLAVPKSSMMAALTDSVHRVAEEHLAADDLTQALRCCSHVSQGMVDVAVKNASLEAVKQLIALGHLGLVKTSVGRVAAGPAIFMLLSEQGVGAAELFTSLTSAVRHNRAEAVQALLENHTFDLGKMISHKTSSAAMNSNSTLLFVAVESGHSQVVASLLAHGADPKQCWEERDIWYPFVPIFRDHSCVGTAVKKGYGDVLRHLLAVTSLSQRQLNRYLRVAEKNGSASVAGVLIGAGAQ